PGTYHTKSLYFCSQGPRAPGHTKKRLAPAARRPSASRFLLSQNRHTAVTPSEPDGKNPLGLGSLGSVLGPRLLAVFNTASIEGTTNDVIANAREILHPAAADQHDGVLLKIVTLTWNVRRHFDAIRKANAGNLAQCRVGHLRRHGLDLRAHTALLRGVVSATEVARISTQRVVGETQRWRLGLLLDALAALASQLIDRRHEKLLTVQWAYRALLFLSGTNSCGAAYTSIYPFGF